MIPRAGLIVVSEGGRGSIWLFALLCLIWGTTWIAIKAGVSTVPPLFFAASRFTVAGAILLLAAAVTGAPRLARSDHGRVGAGALLLIALC